MYGGFIEKGAVYDGTSLFEPCWTDVSATLVGKHPHHPHSWEIYRDNHGQPWATIPSVMGWWEFPLGFLASKSAGFWCLGISMIQGNPLVQIEKKHTNVANTWKTISQEVLVILKKHRLFLNPISVPSRWSLIQRAWKPRQSLVFSHGVSGKMIYKWKFFFYGEKIHFLGT